MKKLRHTEAKLKKYIAYKKERVVRYFEDNSIRI